jgi:hypothetical protein
MGSKGIATKGGAKLLEIGVWKSEIFWSRFPISDFQPPISNEFLAN